MSCDDFIQLSNPDSALVSDGSTVLNAGYWEWAGDDPFLQGRAFNANSTGFSGWLKLTADKIGYSDIMRVQNDMC